MEKVKNILLLIGFAALCGLQNVQAQDLHFSQYYNTPLLTNPANTGFSPDADYRVGINYRNQWATVSNNPYKTMSAWGDVQLFNDRFENGWVGVGGALLRDQAGSGNLTSTKAYGTVAYHQLLGLGSLLSFGVGGGYVNKRVDLSKLSFDDQWNGKFFDVTIPSGEPFAASSVSYFDLQAGVNYAYFPNENSYINFGISVDHINRPKESFFSEGQTTAQIDPRYNFFLNGSFKLNDFWIVNPNVYYSQISSASETVFGLNAQFNLSGDGASQLLGGVYYRWNDAAIPMVGFLINGFKLSFSYDATTSPLSTFNQTRGAYELSIVKTGLFNPSRPLKCPTVRFE